MITIDNGSGMMKGGLAGDESPRTSFPTIYGSPRDKSRPMIEGKTCFVGDEACMKAAVLSMNHPIQRGIIRNWDEMEKIWHHLIYNDLSVDPTDIPVLVTDVIHNPKSNREKMASIMFETFMVPEYNVGITTKLDLLASGRLSGIIVDVGDGITSVDVFDQCNSIKYARTHQKIGGSDITNYLSRLLADSTGEDFSTNSRILMCQGIKDESCYVSLDYKNEKEKPEKYPTPAGDKITIARERFEAPELLFNPQLDECLQDGCEMLGIVDLIHETISKCTPDKQDELYENIVLCGGTATMEGFAERVDKELRALEPEKSIQIHLSDTAKYATWVGTSIMGSIPAFQQLAISREEYEESGVSIVHRLYE